MIYTVHAFILIMIFHLHANAQQCYYDFALFIFDALKSLSYRHVYNFYSPQETV